MPEVVGRSSRGAGSGREALAEGWEKLLEGRGSLSEGQEPLPKDREWLGVLFGGPGVVGMPSRRAGFVLKALLEGWEWLRGPSGGSEGPPGMPGVVGKPSRRAGSSL